MTLTPITMAPRPQPTSRINLTVCHHGDQQFYELGQVMLEADPVAFLATIPRQPPHDCDAADTCIILDLHDASGCITDDREITAAAAEALLEGQYAPRLQQARDNLAAYIARYDASPGPA